MRRGVVIFFGIIGALLSVFLGLYSVVTWEIVAVLVAISLGIPSLIVTYEKGKPEERVSQRKGERQPEIDTIELPAPLRARGKKKKNALLPDDVKITELNVDNSLLDEVHEKAHRKAINIYHDAQLSRFCIQVHPFQEVGERVNIYLDFYSKWADRTCDFVYHESSRQVKHLPPNRRPTDDYDRGVFTTLPWKKSPQWLRFLKRVSVRIPPLPVTTGTNYHLSALSSPSTYWSVTFDDQFSGDKYSFEWSGKGLDKNNIKER